MASPYNTTLIERRYSELWHANLDGAEPQIQTEAPPKRASIVLMGHGIVEDMTPGSQFSKAVI